MILSTIYSISKMTKRLRLILFTLLIMFSAVVTAFDKGHVPTLGIPIDQDTINSRDTLIFPDGSGLPAGRGNVAMGAKLYVQHCLLCHGANGRGGSAEELSGGRPDLTRDPPDQTIGTYWPYATTLFDFIRRAMPMHVPGSLSNDNSYALTAYLLHENGILPAEAQLDAQSLMQLKMPNHDGFIWVDVSKNGKLTRQ